MGGPNGGEPYTKLYAKWNAALLARKASGRECNVFAELARYQSEVLPDGTVKAWRPKEDVATSLGLSSESVKSALRGLRDKGCIKPVGKAHKGEAQVYQLMPGCPVAATAKGCGSHTPKKRERGAGAAPKGCPTDTPTIRIEGGPPSDGRANPKRLY